MSSKPTEFAGKIPETPFAVKSLSIIILSRSLFASSKSFFASVPYLVSSNIDGYFPFNSHVKKNGVQSI